MRRGAGGTTGGEGDFILGLIMMIAGGYLFLKSVHIDHYLSIGTTIFSMGGVQVTNGMVLIPFIFGIGLVFYNSNNNIGWILSITSLIAMFFGIIASINFSLQGMSAFDILMILVLMVGGAGMFFRSLKSR